MTAGILSYQLCERQFDCERCPLDRALRAHFRRAGPAAGEPAPGAEPAGRCEPLRGDRLYSRGHCWLKWIEGPTREVRGMRVGIEPGLAGALLVPRAVVREEPGDAVRRGEAHLWIVTEGGTFGIATPVTGRLERANPLLHDWPHLLRSQPMDEGWLFELGVPVDSPDLRALLDAEAAERHYGTDARRFQDELRAALDSKSTATPTLQDGGAMLQGISDMLGPARYFSLLRRVYG